MTKTISSRLEDLEARAPAPDAEDREPMDAAEFGDVLAERYDEIKAAFEDNPNGDRKRRRPANGPPADVPVG